MRIRYYKGIWQRHSPVFGWQSMDIETGLVTLSQMLTFWDYKEKAA